MRDNTDFIGGSSDIPMGVVRHLTKDQLIRVAAAASDVREYGPRETLLRRWQPIQHSSLLLSGFLSRHLTDRKGIRQMVAIQVAGDFSDLHSYPLGTLDHDIETLSAVRLAIFPHQRLTDLCQSDPVLARQLWKLTLIDSAIHRQWIFRLGRLRAMPRLADFLCEMNARLVANGQSDGRRFALPLTQTGLADACGMTAIHVNRVLRELRDAGLCSFRDQMVEIHDLDGLQRLGTFDPRYLYLPGPPDAAATVRPRKA